MININNHPNPKNIKAELFTIVKAETEETFGRRIVTSRDCLHLCEEIYFKTSLRVNFNTLRRFFGLIKAEYPPSLSTLNILTRYCGFNSLDEIVGAKHTSINNEHESENQSFLNYLITLFKSTQVKDANDETFFSLVKHTIHFLGQHPVLADKFQRAIVKTKNGHDFYFEQFVNTDKLNSFYGEGLRYYINEKRSPETETFGYSLLCQRDWLTGNHATLKKNFEHIKAQNLSALTSLVYGRYFAAHLFYADAFGLDTDTILQEAYQAHSKIKSPQNNYRLFHSFEYTFSLALILTRHFEEALYYINYALLTHPEKHSYADQGCYKRLSLLKAIALCKTGAAAEAEKIYHQLRPSQFYFLSKKFDTILYLLLAGYLKKGNQKLRTQMMALIDETGFTKLQALEESHFYFKGASGRSKKLNSV